MAVFYFSKISPAKQDWETEGELFEEEVAKLKRDLRVSGWFGYCCYSCALYA